MKFLILPRVLIILVLALVGAVSPAARAQLVSSGQITYSLTAPTTDPVAPGQTAEFIATVSNTGSTQQRVTLRLTVPNFTTCPNINGLNFQAGANILVFDGYLNAGQSASASIRPAVISGNQAPPDGSNITLTVQDNDRGVSVARAFTVRYAPALRLQLAASQATVAPGQPVTYTLAYHNAGTSAAPDATLRVPLPAGTAFVSADGGGAVGGDGVIQWSLGTLPAGGHGRLQLTLALSSSATTTPLLPIEATLSDGAGNVARASDARVVVVAPQITYSLTAPTTDPVAPGQTAEFIATVSNTGSTQQRVTLRLTVPNFTTCPNINGLNFQAGANILVFDGYLNAGQSASASIRPAVISGNQAPPDGSNITLTVQDNDRGVSVARAFTVRYAPALRLQLAASQATVAPGQPVTYTLAYHNAGTSAAPDATLRVPLPAGTAFVSADGGGAVGGDGVIQWSLGTLPAGGHGRLQLTLALSSSATTTPLLPIEATLSDGAGNVARASDARVVVVAPQITYSLTAPTTDPVAPGQTAEFIATVSNTGSTQQRVTLRLTVPNFTTCPNINGLNFQAGANILVFDGYLNAGQSASASIRPAVISGNQAPPDGSNITLTVQDNDRGVLIGGIVTVATPSPRITSASSASGQSGQPFTYQITATNSPTHYAATGLPAGLSLNTATGLISGTATATGAFPVTLSATNSQGTGSTVLALTLTASAVSAPRITSATSAGSIVNRSFTYQIVATNSPASFSADGLPPGLTVDANTGLIFGTLAAQGDFSVTLRATNVGGTGRATLSINVQPSRERPLVSVFSAPGRGGFLISRADGRRDVDVVVFFHNGGSASRGGDYVAFPTTITIPAGQTDVVLPVTLRSGANRGKKVKVFLDPDPADSYDIGKAQTKVFLSDLP